MIQPDYIFETSWEVCNRVGGIYAVLSTRAASMQREHPDRVVFFGPDFGEHSNTYFREDPTLMPAFAQRFRQLHPELPIRLGRWCVPGEPLVVLIRPQAIQSQLNTIYAWAWEKFQVRSHAAYGDYDESAVFGYATGLAMHAFYDTIVSVQPKARVVAHSNEWQTAFALFYLCDHCPRVATLFTTHATGIGRSIAGNGKPLYDYFEGYHGNQMAEELNFVSKHSVERQAAHYADCFTTVSDLTARECAQLLDRPVDIVTPNGFELDFVPQGRAFDTARRKARRALLSLANRLLEHTCSDTTRLLCIAGRQEWKNKGIDVFLQSMSRLGERMYHEADSPEVVAFVMIPYLDRPVMRCGKVSVIFVPYYLDGRDPYFQLSYYDLLIGMDATVFPSYYEPWGYTPLESVAFRVPTITTSLAGFGVWAGTSDQGLKQGVCVIRRTDSNQAEVVERICDNLLAFFHYSPEEVTESRRCAAAIAQKAQWSNFFAFYRQAYTLALSKKY